MSCTLSVTYVLFFNKISMIRFYQWKLYSQMLGQKPAISDRQRKAPIWSFPPPHSRHSSLILSSYTISKTPSNSNVPVLCFLCISLSVLLSPSYSLCFFFLLIIQNLLPVNWLFASSLDLWLTWLYSILITIFKQKAFVVKVCVRADPQPN